ncbi:MAG: NfeD family protein [Caldilineaceae bacterium]
MADNVDDLLAQMDGFVVDLNGVERSLDTAGAQQVPVDLTPIERFLNFISDPTIASLLLSLGILGLIIEIRTPGIGVPGVVGAISLLLAFYALGQLDANFVGIALIGLAAALFVAEAFTPTFGILAVGGIAAFIFGALLFNETGYPVPWPAIIALAVVMGAVTIWIGAKAMAAQRRPVLTGSEALIGQTARAGKPSCAGEIGQFVAGANWNAKLDQGEVAAGDQVRITGRDGYTLNVRSANEQ